MKQEFDRNDNLDGELTNLIISEMNNSSRFRKRMEGLICDLMTNLYGCLITAQMMDFAKKSINENTDGIEECLKNPNNKGKYINGDEAKQEKGLNAIIDDTKAIFENQAKMVKICIGDETSFDIQKTANKTFENIINISSTFSKQEVTKTQISLFELLIVSELLKVIPEMVENENLQNAAQTTAEKIDEINFTPIKVGKFGVASSYASSEVLDVVKKQNQELRNRLISISR